MHDAWDPAPLLDVAGLALPDAAAPRLRGRDPVLGARHRIGEAAAAAAAAAGCWIARYGELRGLPEQQVEVDVVDASTALLGFVFQSVDGGPGLDRVFSPFTDLFATADDRWIHLHGGFSHLADGTAQLLGCAEDRDAIAAAVARWDAEELEAALAERGLCGAVVRTHEQWAAHPQGRAVEALPAVRLRRLGPAGTTPPPPADRPLTDLRVLDLTRVLAGPTIGRTLAGHGADVLRVDGTSLPTIEPFALDTGRGKRRALCDLDDPTQRERLLSLVDDADVVVQGYRQGALEARGLGAEELAERRPGLVVARLSCYGPEGPWSPRRGWEQLAQATSGMAHAEDPDRPHLVPAAATDYTTGYLGAAGVAEALVRRTTEGGSWLVEVSLCQTAAWLIRLGATCDPAAAIGLGDVAARQQRTATTWGTLRHLAPIERLSVTPAGWDLPPSPRGSSALAWADPVAAR